MATYKVNQGISTSSGERFEVGSTVTDDDLSQTAVRWLLSDGVLVPQEESALQEPSVPKPRKNYKAAALPKTNEEID